MSSSVGHSPGHCTALHDSFVGLPFIPLHVQVHHVPVDVNHATVP
jgi:hypothetical protein